MTLELHVWGPAFDLPSIDAPCLAAIFYLRQCLPPNDWSLVSSDPHRSPLGELPALRDGDICVAGFHNIVAYLKDVSALRVDLDKSLDDVQRAQATAFSSFIESRAQPLLDLSLYVSSDNYFNSTRTALGDILSWPTSWTIPHRLRDRAKRRSEHLGLSSLDVDAAQEDAGTEHTSLTAHIPKSLRKPKLTVSGILGRSVQKNRIRLDAVTADFLDPLSQLLGEKEWLLGPGPTTVDCLAVAYLTLMQQPELPHPWLKDALGTKYLKLGEWARLKAAAFVGLPVSRDEVTGTRDIQDSRWSSVLPWQSPRGRTWQQVAQEVVESCVTSIPLLASAYDIPVVHPSGSRDRNRFRQKQMALAKVRHQQIIYTQMIASASGVVALVGFLFWKGILQLPRGTPKSSTRSFGEAGALLGLG